VALKQEGLQALVVSFDESGARIEGSREGRVSTHPPYVVVGLMLCGEPSSGRGECDLGYRLTDRERDSLSMPIDAETLSRGTHRDCSAG
jgi:hypothetical protein